MDSWDDSTPKTYIKPMHLHVTNEHKLEKKSCIGSHVVNSASSHVLFTRATPTQAIAHSHKANGNMRVLTSCMCALAHHHTHTPTTSISLRAPTPSNSCAYHGTSGHGMCETHTHSTQTHTYITSNMLMGNTPTYASHLHHMDTPSTHMN